MKVDTQHNHPQEPGPQLIRNTLKSTFNHGRLWCRWMIMRRMNLMK
jgi:hypothetical protein